MKFGGDVGATAGSVDSPGCMIAAAMCFSPTIHPLTPPYFAHPCSGRTRHLARHTAVRVHYDDDTFAIIEQGKQGIGTDEVGVDLCRAVGWTTAAYAWEGDGACGVRALRELGLQG